MKKNVTVSLDEDINERWTKVAKKHDLSKSAMVQDFIVQILPILEEQQPNKMLQRAFKEMGKQIELTGSLFDGK